MYCILLYSTLYTHTNNTKLIIVVRNYHIHIILYGISIELLDHPPELLSSIPLHSLLDGWSSVAVPRALLCILVLRSLTMLCILVLRSLTNTSIHVQLDY